MQRFRSVLIFSLYKSDVELSIGCRVLAKTHRINLKNDANQMWPQVERSLKGAIGAEGADGWMRIRMASKIIGIQ